MKSGAFHAKMSPWNCRSIFLDLNYDPKFQVLLIKSIFILKWVNSFNFSQLIKIRKIVALVSIYCSNSNMVHKILK